MADNSQYSDNLDLLAAVQFYTVYTLQTGHCCRLDTERREANSRVETASFGLTWLYVFFMGESESGIVGSSLDQPNRYIV